jgi:hypothetical protein
VAVGVGVMFTYTERVVALAWLVASARGSGVKEGFMEFLDEIRANRDLSDDDKMALWMEFKTLWEDERFEETSRLVEMRNKYERRVAVVIGNRPTQFVAVSGQEVQSGPNVLIRAFTWPQQTRAVERLDVVRQRYVSGSNRIVFTVEGMTLCLHVEEGSMTVMHGEEEIGTSTAHRFAISCEIEDHKILVQFERR